MWTLCITRTEKKYVESPNKYINILLNTHMEQNIFLQYYS